MIVALPAPVRANYGPMRMRLYETAPELTVGSELLDDGLCGVYDRESDVILIDRRMTYTRKRCTLVHELVHRAHGDDDHTREHRCRMQTAGLLIDPAEYALAERMYEGNTWLMAEELNVTPQIIDDYRELLHDRGE